MVAIGAESFFNERTENVIENKGPQLLECGSEAAAFNPLRNHPPLPCKHPAGAYRRPQCPPGQRDSTKVFFNERTENVIENKGSTVCGTSILAFGPPAATRAAPTTVGGAALVAARAPRRREPRSSRIGAFLREQSENVIENKGSQVFRTSNDANAVGPGHFAARTAHASRSRPQQQESGCLAFLADR